MADISNRVTARTRCRQLRTSSLRLAASICSTRALASATLTPSARNLLNSFIFSYNRNNGTVISGAPFSFASLGIPIASTTPPELQLAVTGYFTIGSGHPRQVNRHDFHISDSLHWVIGAHEMAFGGDFLRMDVDLDQHLPPERAIHIQRHAATAAIRCADFCWATRRNSFRAAANIAQRPAISAAFSFRTITGSRRNLMLNLGLRWDPFVPYSDELGRTECFRPGHAIHTFPECSDRLSVRRRSGCPAGGFQVELDAVRAPFRFRLQRRRQGKTTIRGGWGIFYQPPFVEAFNNMVDSAPFSPQYQFFGVPFMNPYQCDTPIRSRPSSLRNCRRRTLPFANPLEPGRVVSAELEAFASHELEFDRRAPVGKRPPHEGGLRRIEGHAPRLQHRRKCSAAEPHCDSGQ